MQPGLCALPSCMHLCHCLASHRHDATWALNLQGAREQYRGCQCCLSKAVRSRESGAERAGTDAHSTRDWVLWQGGVVWVQRYGTRGVQAAAAAAQAATREGRTASIVSSSLLPAASLPPPLLPAGTLVGSGAGTPPSAASSASGGAATGAAAVGGCWPAQSQGRAVGRSWMWRICWSEGQATPAAGKASGAGEGPSTGDAHRRAAAAAQRVPAPRPSHLCAPPAPSTCPACGRW